MQYQVTFNKNSSVYQHNYESELEPADFLALMSSEWMIDKLNDDDITIEVLTSA